MCVFSLIRVISGNDTWGRGAIGEVLNFDIGGNVNFDVKIFGNGEEGERDDTHYVVNGRMVDGEARLVLIELVEWAIAVDWCKAAGESTGKLLVRMERRGD
jgi:hypothetical protein